MKVLLLDAAFAAAPIYRFLKQAGHEVWVMGNRPGDLLARKAGAHWIDQDYSDVEAVQAHVTRLGIERVVPGCTDVSIHCCARLPVAASFMDSAEITDILGNKSRFRAVCATLDLPAPRVVDAAAFPRAGRYIAKPVDAFSGRGITIFDGMDADGPAQALSLARAASPAGTAIVETFAEGQLHSCSAFIERHKVVEDVFVLEGSSANPYAVDTSYVSHDVPAACAGELRMALERLSGFLGLRDGLLHTQFILSEGRPVIIELTRRCPGDLYPLLIQYGTGLAHAAKYASYFLGTPLPVSRGRRRHILRHTVTADADTCYEGLTFLTPQEVLSYFPIAALGESLYARQKNRAGVLFTESADRAALRAAYECFLNRRAYRVDDMNLVSPTNG